MPSTAPSTPTKSIDHGVGSAPAREALATAALAQLYASAPSPGEVLREGVRPLRIMVLAPEVSVYQRFSARDMGCAFASVGAESTVYLIKQRDSWRVDLLESIRAVRPDAIFVFSQRRGSLPELPPELSLLIWDQDYLCGFDSSSSGWRIESRDRVWTLMKEWREQLMANGVPSDKIGHLNMGANTDLYHPPDGNEPIEHEVLFVGNIHPFERYRRMVQLHLWPEAAQAIMLHARERLYEWMRTRDANEPYVIPEMEGFLLESAEALAIAVDTDKPNWALMVRYFRYRLAHYVVRECVIESLMDFRLGLYGHGWDQFPKIKHLARPPINNGPEMLEVMHRSAVHVQLHTWTVHHPRLYDTAAAGGYLLVGRVPEEHPLGLEFELGEELESFGSIAELRTKIRQALENPGMMRSVGARAAQRVRREHSMVHCASQALEELRCDST